MAPETTASSQIFQNGFIPKEIETAIAKTAELRALHAVLTRGNSPSGSRFPSPTARSVPQSAQDYPVFTPSYDEDEPVHVYSGISSRNRNENSDSRRSRFSPNLFPSESQISPAPSQISVPGSEIYKSSRRNNWGNFKSASSCNRSESIPPSVRNPKFPMTDSHLSSHPQRKSRGLMSWFFPKLKKKHKIQNSPGRAESEQVSQFYNEFGILSVETLKMELIEANASRDKALKEVSEMKSTLEELKQKLEFLEAYCEELKKGLNQQMNPQFDKKVGSLAKRGKSQDGNRENLMPFSVEVMVEGFLQIVSEARLSVKQFSQNLIRQIDDKDKIIMENLDSLLQPYKLSLNSNSRYTKPILYHLEAIINQSFFQDFENSSFQKNGSPAFLDPLQDRQVKFSSFVALRNLSWNEVQKKGTKFYCERFSKFCDRKMSLVISKLNWTTPWPENLLQGFFVAAKCVWLVHLLAFSFCPAVEILRVEEGRGFDGNFMEDLFVDRSRGGGFGRVRVMVMPGFYVQDKVLRCKVLCNRYNKSIG